MYISLRGLNHEQLKSKIIDHRTKRSYTVEEANTPLPKQSIVEVGRLTCVYTGKKLSPAEVNAYNGFTEEYNRSTWRPDQDFLLDQRHRLYHAICLDNLKLQESA